ncbi:MAG TPA: helix-turn-helix domain-containing protein [Noviherbaspirillum sp.]|uniref:GlxA family transcriptional regulator n=1 Tax=Noviherbaspirillum sp. TaxID=1926288 RepID=UPI002DDD238E|nr:helix-turn-helix domain-containing protein [Noviherbaspirillum sp.]HEV2611965.1 helix-turn-helix domain-containing protein [Noviherbaspirillum sp.]
MNAKPPVRIAILAMPETSASVIYGMYDMFMSAGRDWAQIVEGRAGVVTMVPRVVSCHGDSFIGGNNVRITPDASLAACMDADVVCVPELMVAPGTPLDGRFLEEIACLRTCHAAGKILATACSGAILLAEAGLLDGYEATTHWAYCDLMTRRYPKVKVRTQRALVASGEGQRLIMAGGGTSWLDLALYLIARLAGVEVAMQTARVNLVDWNDIGQQPFASLARTGQAEDAVIARCQTWIADHYAEPSPVAAMIRYSGIPERSFKRRFEQATGMSPLEYVHTLRLEEAKQMLEAGSEPVEAIANEVGYEDAGFFSRLFRRHVNLTPAQYRKRFGGMRKAIQAVT